jgi:hypothetical protein
LLTDGGGGSTVKNLDSKKVKLSGWDFFYFEPDFFTQNSRKL